jgi:uncharacterized membrane protein
MVLQLSVKRRYGLILLISLILVSQIAVIDGSASEHRSAKLSTPFPMIEITGTQRVALTLTVTNEGDTGELFVFSIKGDSDWVSMLRMGNLIVKGVYLEPNQSKEVTFHSTPPPNEESGNYTFEVKATSEDQQVEASTNINVELIGITTPSEIAMSTPYPSLEGPPNQDFEFRVRISNRGSEDRVVELTTEHPQGWSILFNPIYEDRIIRSLEFSAGENREVMVTITPAPDIEQGHYEITVIGTSGELEGSIDFDLTLQGTHEIAITTQDGLVSFDSVQGKDSQIIMVLENTGSAPLENVHFLSSKPPGWEVSFEPNAVPIMEPGTVHEVRAFVTPPSDAIPGDYIMTLTTTVDPWIDEPLHFRTTLLGSVSWGYVGLAFIGAIAVAIYLIFKRFGRR